MLLQRSFLLSLVVAASLMPADILAESFLLKTGGQIDGELLNPKRNAADPYQVKTAGGMRLSLARETVAKVVVVRNAELEYQRLVPKVLETAEGHWEMAEWCREQGLRRQRDHHLQQVLNFDPDHEHAHLALGHSRLGGVWQKLDDYMKNQGYVKHEGIWRTRQDVEIALSATENESQVIKWRKQIDTWISWLGKKRDAEGIVNLKHIRDPHAAPTLLKLLQSKSPQPRELRLLIVDVLSEIEGNPAEKAFIGLALNDADQGIRDACLDHLVRTQSKFAVQEYMGVVRSASSNEKSLPATINRAAVALGRLNDQLATPTLIDALVTAHEILITPGTEGSGGLGPISNSFGSDPGNPASGGFSAGAAKPVKKKIMSTNQQVLTALNTLHPGVNFGFNEALWKKWYEEKHEPATVNLRRAE